MCKVFYNVCANYTEQEHCLLLLGDKGTLLNHLACYWAIFPHCKQCIYACLQCARCLQSDGCHNRCLKCGGCTLHTFIPNWHYDSRHALTMDWKLLSFYGLINCFSAPFLGKIYTICTSIQCQVLREQICNSDNQNDGCQCRWLKWCA